MKHLIFILAICFCQPAHGQTNLAAVRQQMFNDSNDRFIALDLISDKLLSYDQPFVFSHKRERFLFICTRNVSRLNGKKLPAKYTQFMREYYNHIGRRGSFNWTSNGVRLAEVLDSTSSFRTYRWNAAERKFNHK